MRQNHTAVLLRMLHLDVFFGSGAQLGIGIQFRSIAVLVIFAGLAPHTILSI